MVLKTTLGTLLKNFGLRCKARRRSMIGGVLEFLYVDAKSRLERNEVTSVFDSVRVLRPLPSLPCAKRQRRRCVKQLNLCVQLDKTGAAQLAPSCQ